jgi:AraC-like DNA-binding protein
MFSSFLYAVRDKPEFRHVIDLLRPKMSRANFQAFTRNLRMFRRFCRAYGLVPAPATRDTLLRYIHALRRHYARTSILQILQPIATMHRECGYQSPRSDRLVTLTLQAMKKSFAKQRFAVPMLLASFCRLMGLLPTSTPKELRARAVCATAYWGMLSSAELGTLSLDRCDRGPDTWTFYEVGARRRTVEIERARDPQYCPIAALQRYMTAFKIRKGQLWRNCSFNGAPRSTAAKHMTLNRDFTTCAAMQLIEFRGFTFDSLRTGSLEEAFHAGVSYRLLVERAGFSDEPQLLRRLHQITTYRAGDRALPHAGHRARGRKRPARRRYWSKSATLRST